MPGPRVYGELAYLWPLLSPVEDYAADAEAIVDVITDKLGSPGAGGKRSVVEFGAGGGHTLRHLSKDFDTTAVDLSDAMLDCSRRLNLSTQHIVGDMRSIRMDQKFDVVLIHDAVDYLRNRDDLRAMLDTARQHLNPGGIVLIAPTYVTETFEPGQTVDDLNANDDVQVRYLSRIAAVAGRDDAFELCMTIVIRKQGDDGLMTLQIEHDRHVCGLFSTATWLRLMADVGFEVEERCLLQDIVSEDFDARKSDMEPDVPMFIGQLMPC